MSRKALPCWPHFIFVHLLNSVTGNFTISKLVVLSIRKCEEVGDVEGDETISPQPLSSRHFKTSFKTNASIWFYKVLLWMTEAWLGSFPFCLILPTCPAQQKVKSGFILICGLPVIGCSLGLFCSNSTTWFLPPLPPRKEMKQSPHSLYLQGILKLVSKPMQVFDFTKCCFEWQRPGWDRFLFV